MQTLIVPTTVIAVGYTILSVYLMNYRLVFNTLIANYPFEYRMTILVHLLQGAFTAMPPQSLIILFAIATLTGVNLVLLRRHYLIRRENNALPFMAAGSLFGLIGSSCPACGLPVLALIGMSSLIFLLPFGGFELSLVSLSLLVVSLYVLTKQGICRKT